MFSEESLKWLPETPGWVPAECDVPIRKDRWFWHPDEEHLLPSVDQLMDIYYRSVGHGATLLLNVAPDHHGLLPESDVRRLLDFGSEIKSRFGHALAEVSIGEIVQLTLPQACMIDHAVVRRTLLTGNG